MGVERREENKMTNESTEMSLKVLWRYENIYCHWVRVNLSLIGP